LLSRERVKLVGRAVHYSYCKPACSFPGSFSDSQKKIQNFEYLKFIPGLKSNVKTSELCIVTS
jgi:hypothetical protein